MKRSTGEIVEWTPGSRGEGGGAPILARDALDLLHRTLHSVETLLGYPPDVEWTGTSADLTLLQARPITRPAADDGDQRSWYLSLRPGTARLEALCARVSEELIPALASEAARFAAEDIEPLSDGALADAIQERLEALERWRAVYWDEFIPFAHGVRRLGLYYNDAVRPDDPYEFVKLLKDQTLLASERNAALARLAAAVRRNEKLAARLAELNAGSAARTRSAWRAQAETLSCGPDGAAFADAFERFLDEYLNISFDDESLGGRPDLALALVLELARGDERGTTEDDLTAARLEERLLDAVGEERHAEAIEVLRIGRMSWKLRDDDNILMARLENQLQRALALAGERLKRGGRLAEDAHPGPDAAAAVMDALRAPGGGPVRLPPPDRSPEATAPAPPGETPRQLTGQPAAPGWATGRVRVVRTAEDFARFVRGDVMVCDAIQPTMTHLVPLAGAIVERRGGMLIHGAIIARELGVPCVNGVSGAPDRLRDGDLVTVDGDLGIVTVGPPEFELESGAAT